MTCFLLMESFFFLTLNLGINGEVMFFQNSYLFNYFLCLLFVFCYLFFALFFFIQKIKGLLRWAGIVSDESAHNDQNLKSQIPTPKFNSQYEPKKNNKEVTHNDSIDNHEKSSSVFSSQQPSDLVPVKTDSSQAEFEGVKIPRQNNPVSEEFFWIRENFLKIIENAKGKFESGDLGFIGAGNHYPRVLKIADIQKYDEIALKSKPFVFEDSDKWFFIGDLHGDFYAFYMFLKKVKEVENFRLCFLGDLVDRGPYSAECFGLILKMVAEFPNQILWIVGNHDCGVKRTRINSFEKIEESPVQKHQVLESVKGFFYAFDSDVIPAEFLSWLNKKESETPDLRFNLGKFFTDVCETLPRAVLFPNGLLATHGGIPLSDRLDTIKDMEGLLQKRTLNDFTWNRAADVKSRLFNEKLRPTNFDFEFGYSDLEKFCLSVSRFFPVKAVIRGHDHVEKGVEFLSKYKVVPLLTLNGFGFNHQNNSLRADYYKDSIPYVELDHSQAIPKDIKSIEIDKMMLKEFYVFD